MLYHRSEHVFDADALWRRIDKYPALINLPYTSVRACVHVCMHACVLACACVQAATAPLRIPLLALFGGLDATPGATPKRAASLERALYASATTASTATTASADADSASDDESRNIELRGGDDNDGGRDSNDFADFRVMIFPDSSHSFAHRRTTASTEAAVAALAALKLQTANQSPTMGSSANGSGGSRLCTSGGASGSGASGGTGHDGDDGDWRSDGGFPDDRPAWEAVEDASDALLIATAWLDLYNRPPPVPPCVRARQAAVLLHFDIHFSRSGIFDMLGDS